MSTLSCTIGGTSVTVKNGSFSITKGHGQRGMLALAIEDATGTLALYRGQEIVLSDSVAGPIYTGFVQQATPDHLAVDLTQPYREISITAMDNQYLVDKRANDQNYKNLKAGDVTANFVEGTLGDEGITGAYTQRYLTSIDDWNTGTLTGTTSLIQTDGTGGQLQLAPGGKDFTYTEATTSDFSGGVLTNCIATNNTLLPTSGKALKMVSTLNSGNVGNTISSMKIWSGSVPLSSANYYLNYDIFIDPSSPQAKASLNIFFSDGTNTSSLDIGTHDSPDGQGLPPLPTIDLTGLATVTWYNRGFALGADHGGKTVVSVSLDIAGSTPGTYTVYIRRANFSDGLFINTIVPPLSVLSYIFETSLNINPPQQLQFYGYVNTSVTVVDTYDLRSAKVLGFGGDLGLYRTFTEDTYDNSTTNRIVGPLSVGSVGILKGSLISWTVNQPTNTILAIWYSLDDMNYIRCTNNAPLPNLPAGLDLTGKNLYLSYQFFQLSGANVESTPILEGLTLNLYSSWTATKTDISYAIRTQTDWNTGTLTNLVSSTLNEISTNGVIRFWDDGNFDGQSVFGSIGAQAATYNRAYRIGINAGVGEMTLKQTFAGTWQNFTIEVDVKVPTASVQGALIYRQTNFGNGTNNFAYALTLASDRFELGKGSNSSSSGGGTYTAITNTIIASQVGSWHRIKAVVSGNSHQCYLDDVLLLTATDSTYTAAGYTGLHVYNPTANEDEVFFDNFGVQVTLSGTWVSPGTSLTSVGTYYTSVISWRDKSHEYSGGQNTTITLEASYDNGVTYTICTNGSPLPVLNAGDSLTGKTLVLRATLATTTAASIPALDNLTVRIIGSGGTVTGKRTTLPTLNDTMIGSNAVGSWPNTTDGQIYTKVGTGTIGRTSNENTIGATTGDVWMLAGTTTLGDQEATTRFSLSNSSTVGGIQLRHVDNNTFYRFSISATSVSIVKYMGGAATTLAITSIATTPGTYYQLKFRITGSDGGLVTLGGKIWPDGTAEPGLINGTLSRTDPGWTVSATD